MGIIGKIGSKINNVIHPSQGTQPKGPKGGSAAPTDTFEKKASKGKKAAKAPQKLDDSKASPRRQARALRKAKEHDHRAHGRDHRKEAAERRSEMRQHNTIPQIATKVRADEKQVEVLKAERNSLKSAIRNLKNGRELQGERAEMSLEALQKAYDQAGQSKQQLHREIEAAKPMVLKHHKNPPKPRKVVKKEEGEKTEAAA